MTIHDIKNQQDAAIKKLFNEVGLFFAFNNEKMKEGLKNGKVVSVGAGGFLPENNVQLFKDGLNRLESDYIKAIEDNNLREDLIDYELANHECYYTGDIEIVLYALPECYTIEEVYKVYKKNYAAWEACN